MVCDANKLITCYPSWQVMTTNTPHTDDVPTSNKPGGPNDVNMGMVNYDGARIVIQPNMSQAQAEIAGAVMNHSLGMFIDVKHHPIKQS